MSCRWAPAACAAAAAAIAFCTIIRARPSKVAGSVCTQAIGIVRRPSRITIISPSGPFSSTTALPPRRTQRSTRSFSCIENRITEPLQALRIPRDELVVGVQDGPAGLRDGLDDHPLDRRELLDRVDRPSAPGGRR